MQRCRKKQVLSNFVDSFSTVVYDQEKLHL